MVFENLETERINLKNISSDDVEFIYSQFSNDGVNTYLFDAEPVSDKEEAMDIIRFYTTPEPRNQHRWILVRKSDGKKMGTCGFHCWNREQGSIEIGYDLNPDFWCNGYMQEAMTAILTFAKEKLNIKRFDAHIYPENEKSVALAKKLGFRFYGETTNYEFHGQDYVHHIYSLVI